MKWMGLTHEVQAGGLSGFELWGVPVFIALFFYVLGVLTAVYIKQPKLVISGGGSSGNGRPDGFQEIHITVRNAPGRVGITLGQTILFGLKLIKRRRHFGMPFVREPAVSCTAELYDDKGTRVCPLYWRDPRNNNSPTISLDLASGEQTDLYLFAQQNADSTSYFPYEPGTGESLTVPALKFSGSQRFKVRIRYADGQKKRDFKYTITQNYRDGRINYRRSWRRP